MNATDFMSTSIAILRSAVGWQSAIARKLDIDARTVRRWISDDAVPGWAAEKLAAMIGATDISPWPRDEWMVGQAKGGNGKAREYIYHMQAPRFLARVVLIDENGHPLPEDEPADVLSGVVYACDDETVLCEIEWIDQVHPGEMAKWLDAAADALDAIWMAD